MMRTSQALHETAFEDLDRPLKELPAQGMPAQIHEFPPGSLANTAMHPGVYKVALLCWGAFLSVFWLTFWVSGNALFMVLISTVYAAVFFTVPWILSRIAAAHNPPRQFQAFADFLGSRFDTLYGSVTGLDALLQVILVPFLLGGGGMIIGFIIRAARLSH